MLLLDKCVDDFDYLVMYIKGKKKKQRGNTMNIIRIDTIPPFPKQFDNYGLR